MGMFRTTTAAVATMAVLAVSCGTDDGGDQADAERVAALEDRLADAEQRTAELAAENADLEAELEAARAEADGEADDGADDDATDDGDGAGTVRVRRTVDARGAAPQPIRSPEGLSEQLRLLFDPGEVPEGFEPATTEWGSRPVPDGLEEVYGSPGELAMALAAGLDAESLGMEQWETTTRVLLDPSDDDQAYVAVLSWGFADDAVAGRDVRMTITRTDEGWAPGGAEERHHCRRGVDGDLCL
jgi:hypothetical protein